MAVDFRRAVPSDAESVAEVYLRSRKELVACAPLVHSDECVRGWVREHLIPAGRTTVAVVDDRIVGFSSVAMAGDCGWIEQLYLHPAWIGRGVGTALLARARAELSPPIRLYTFQCNTRARDFYERRGFRAVKLGDGSGNEEKCPDVLYEWP